MLGELNQEQISNLLRSQVVGRIGCCHKDQVYVVPVTYAFNEGSIYVYSKEGLKIQMMRENANVCFEVDQIEDLANWQSTILWGTFEELQGKEAKQALQFLTNRFIPLVTSETFRPRFGLDKKPGMSSSKMKMIVFRIKITEFTGRYEKSK